MLRCEIITLFPDMVRAVLGASILRRACEAGLVDVRVIDLRDYTVDRHRTADDVPYGGGAGMVLKVEPVARAVDALRTDGEPRRWLLTSPRGRSFSHELATEFSREGRCLTLLCGHYEGVDERIHGTAEWEDVSIGDYVLTGGELAALVMLDATARLVPGVLGDPRSAHEESFVHSLLEYPQYTRPAEFRGMRVPEVLLSGHHQAISQWRRDQSLQDTRRRRPDLFERVAATEEGRSRVVSDAGGSSADLADGMN
ncbi:MAG TPA: tRNA (guanosine(37)-N1)-methyltransferase TrmD [Nitrospiria bacterium]|nr:tRNA (guanosine(37)-N1)-methyltransferase TrmD [Nitrospiria bacterium]